MVIMNFHEIIKPRKIEAVGEVTDRYGEYVAEPYEKGFGITIGNALRRVLLATIEGTAVVGVKIDGVSNEFATLEGVYEDVVDILMNIKMLDLKLHTHETRRVYIKKTGEGPVTAGDITGDTMVEILTPDQHICTITDPNKELNMEFVVQRGIGYVPAEELEKDYDEIDMLSVDAVFTPIKKVNYHVDNARVGQSTDYDRLTLEVETDGSINPEDAIGFAAKIIKDQMNLFINFDEPVVEVKQDEEENQNDQLLDLLDKSIEELELSVRAYNCLKNANIKTLAELCMKTDAEMLKTKNFGRKSLEEIKKVLQELGLSLGMDLEAIGYNNSMESEEE
ncbi:DNA-directed RNA polymerase, alpha subunit [Denitrovibrio acetiphilus DSM 12809]|uniref:DNA-directed RNA polymerase subunit alpha n=1 Tax=Denitrovibrio acetiphilus (strain DSM 12809 / NBRC 114555 / N2460) TaxID=522772 RepID=D4H3B5_DENA2|nr:DNA-directed RNA polymerase subunit alpha [Denitrovibrio acetiphilus]ADD67199.1 DNA-directed RNA polymerase, alpha subunit [Denitrovibrio acetiphilus DSM 12809]